MYCLSDFAAVNLVQEHGSDFFNYAGDKGIAHEESPAHVRCAFRMIVREHVETLELNRSKSAESSGFSLHHMLESGWSAPSFSGYDCSGRFVLRVRKRHAALGIFVFISVRAFSGFAFAAFQITPFGQIFILYKEFFGNVFFQAQAIVLASGGYHYKREQWRRLLLSCLRKFLNFRMRAFLPILFGNSDVMFRHCPEQHSVKDISFFVCPSR